MKKVEQTEGTTSLMKYKEDGVAEREESRA